MLAEHHKVLSYSSVLPVQVSILGGGGRGEGWFLLDTGQMLCPVGGALAVNLSQLTCTMM